MPWHTNSTFIILFLSCSILVFVDFMRLSALFVFLIVSLFSAFHVSFKCISTTKLCKNLCKSTLKKRFYTLLIFLTFGWCLRQNTIQKYMWYHATNPLFMHVFGYLHYVNLICFQSLLFPFLPPRPERVFPTHLWHHPVLNVYKCLKSLIYHYAPSNTEVL